MGEIKNAYELYATMQTNFGYKEYSIRLFDNLPEAKNNFFEYAEDFIIGAVAYRNRALKIKDGKPLFILSPKYRFEIETGNGVVLAKQGTKNPKYFVYIDDGFKLKSSIEILDKIEKIEEKYVNARYDGKLDKIIY